MSKVEDSHFKIKADEVRSDTTLKEERGWHKMDVRWLVTNKTQDSRQTVVGRTIMLVPLRCRKGSRGTFHAACFGPRCSRLG